MAGEKYKDRWKTPEGMAKREKIVKAISKGQDFAEILKGFPGTDEYPNTNDLRGIDLSEQELHGANLSACNLRFSMFKASKLRNASFSDSDIRDATFEKADLQDAVFKDALCKRVIFKDANLLRATIEDTNLQEANFRKANLTEAILKPYYSKGAIFEEVIFENTDLRSMNFQTTSLKGASLVLSDLRDVNLTEVDLSNANLSGAKLQGTILKSCNLEGTNLANAEFDAKTNISNALLLNQNNFHSGGWKRKKINEIDLSSAKEGYRILKDYFKDQSKDDDTSWVAFNEKRIERKLFWKEKKLVRWGISSLLNLLCGYGEKPYRVILSSIVWILLFSILYFFTGLEHEKNGLNVVGHGVSGYFNYSLPYSIATFTNFQFADIRATKELNGYIALLEAFVGFFTLGLFIFTLTRRYATR